MLTGAGNVGGPARTKASSFLQKVIAVAYHSPFAVGGARCHFEHFEGNVESVFYGCWRKETLLQIGLFDEHLVRNQDYELNFRLNRAGLKIWQNPAIKYWYSPRRNLRQLFKQYYQYGYWKWKVIRKHGRSAYGRHLVPGTFLLGLFLLLVMAPFLSFTRVILLFILFSYILFLLVGSIIVSKKSSWTYFPILPVVLSTYHVAYGLGFLFGLFTHFLGLCGYKKSPASVTDLSR